MAKEIVFEDSLKKLNNFHFYVNELLRTWATNSHLTIRSFVTFWKTRVLPYLTRDSAIYLFHMNKEITQYKTLKKSRNIWNLFSRVDVNCNLKKKVFSLFVFTNQSGPLSSSWQSDDFVIFIGSQNRITGLFSRCLQMRFEQRLVECRSYWY